ncbi:MAG: peptide-methionine (S)-S-oxide reductase [Gemmatimonadetes bacterium]|nr:peptide-methionine (S)-S-oxide reductase [Gemmatimonadota bacterium]
MTSQRELATLAGGCFWCLEAIFQQLRGVDQAQSGYAGGQAKNPSYEAVCTGTTGHAEVVQVTFDPSAITYNDLLDIFFTVHDPTTLNRQGPDTGTQYRSAVYYHSPEQKKAVEATIAKFTEDHVFDDPIVTEVTQLDVFYPAEEYHKDYYARNPNTGYCRTVVGPKVAKARKTFFDRLKK